jgi:hypothetical protein
MGGCCGGDLGVDCAVVQSGLVDFARVEEVQRAGHRER